MFPPPRSQKKCLASAACPFRYWQKTGYYYRLLLYLMLTFRKLMVKWHGSQPCQQWSGAHKRRKYCALWRDPIHLRATVAKDHRGNLRAMAAGLIITGIIMHTNNFSFFCVRGLGHTAHTQQNTPTDGSLQPPQAIVAFAT